MVHENPLIMLGVPKPVLVRERASGTPERVLGLAEASYLTLSRRYHPDLPGGDAGLMSNLNDAISELRDPDALSFYIDELVGEQDIERISQQQEQREIVENGTKKLLRLTEGCAFVDQFALLGITEATTYIADLTGQRVVIDVLTQSKTTVRVTDINETHEPGDGVVKTRYHGGAWSEASLNQHHREQWVRYTKFSSIEQVKLIGFIPMPTSDTSYGESSTDLVQLEGSPNQHKLSWNTPQNCWFLSELVVGMDVPENVGGLIFYSNGLFAVTDRLLGYASMTK